MYRIVRRVARVFVVCHVIRNFDLQICRYSYARDVRVGAVDMTCISHFLLEYYCKCF